MPVEEKKCENCIWFGKEKENTCGNYLCRNMSEYDTWWSKRKKEKTALMGYWVDGDDE